jgi:hypothetical protein
VSRLTITLRSIDGPDFCGGLDAVGRLVVPEAETPAPRNAVNPGVSLPAGMAFPRPVGADGKPEPARDDVIRVRSIHSPTWRRVGPAPLPRHPRFLHTLMRGADPISFDWSSEPSLRLPSRPRRRGQTAADTDQCRVPADYSVRCESSSTQGFLAFAGNLRRN